MKKLNRSIYKEYWMYKVCRLSTISLKQFRELIFRVMDCDVWVVRWNDPSSNENDWRLSSDSLNIDTAYAVAIEYLYKHGEYDILHESKVLIKFNTINELDLKLSDVLDSKYDEIEIRNFTLYVQYEDKK
jgi:hypothetical protein